MPKTALKRYHQKGYTLPITLILGVIILTSLALWYRQVVLQSFLAERLVEQRGLYIECKSLVPVLVNRLDQLELSALEYDESNFLEIKDNDMIRWRIDRSKRFDKKIRFTFWLEDQDVEIVSLVVNYDRK